MVFDDVMKCHPRLCHKNVLQCSIDSHNPLFVTKLSLGGCARKYNQKVQSPKCHWKVMPPKWLSDISQKCHWETPYLQRLYRNPHHQGAFLFVVLPGSDECTLNADCVDDSHLVFPKYVVLFVFTNIIWRLSPPSMLSRFFLVRQQDFGFAEIYCLICLFWKQQFRNSQSILSYLFMNKVQSSWSSPTSSLSWSPPGSLRSCSSTTYCLRSSWKQPTVFTTSTSSTTSEQSFGIPSL